jgi:predicted DsbA family dithiol-disulfide isomerase
MKVEIWSDVMCPFCYIGKRKFENALQQFEHGDEIEIIWKSFQLDPDLKTEAGKNVNEYLAERKGLSMSHAKQLNDHVTKIAEEVGLHYDFDKAIVANSFNAHRFVHLASKYGKGSLAEECLFRSYFTEGKNIADHHTLIQLGVELGIDGNEVRAIVESDALSNEVLNDIKEAERLGINGVPFFVFNRKYGVSGAQQQETFLAALEKSFSEWQKENEEKILSVVEGDVCKAGEDCK